MHYLRRSNMAIKLSDERCEEIKEEVVKLFDKYGVNCVPINGFEIANKMGVKVIPYSSKSEATRNLCLNESEDGFCVFRNNQWTIFYNDEKQYGRINNTMLHEIGHVILEHTEDSELAEKEVKFFAKYALVPPVLVHKLKIDTPEDIEEIFNVSYEAAIYALIYYKKWLNYGGRFYTPYEEKLLSMFNASILKIKVS
jgi:Zn-dependent peptidase ImmA (M78 family)